VEIPRMARLIFAMQQSLDGYVDHEKFAPGPDLFAHFIDEVRALSGSLYGLRMYQIMRYWDEDQPAWDAAEHAFAAAWRAQPKWVVSRTLTTVGPNAQLVAGDLETTVRDLKSRLEGDLECAGPTLAGGLAALGLIDEYQLYLHPIVLGDGTPFFTGARPPMRLAGSEAVGDGVVRVRYLAG
jgi:dihydrofolate reductase